MAAISASRRRELTARSGYEAVQRAQNPGRAQLTTGCCGCLPIEGADAEAREGRGVGARRPRGGVAEEVVLHLVPRVDDHRPDGTGLMEVSVSGRLERCDGDRRG